MIPYFFKPASVMVPHPFFTMVNAHVRAYEKAYIWGYWLHNLINHTPLVTSMWRHNTCNPPCWSMLWDFLSTPKTWNGPVTVGMDKYLFIATEGVAWSVKLWLANETSGRRNPPGESGYSEKLLWSHTSPAMISPHFPDSACLLQHAVNAGS